MDSSCTKHCARWCGLTQQRRRPMPRQGIGTVRARTLATRGSGSTTDSQMRRRGATGGRAMRAAQKNHWTNTRWAKPTPRSAPNGAHSLDNSQNLVTETHRSGCSCISGGKAGQRLRDEGWGRL
jgi:hypothetical protein